VRADARRREEWDRTACLVATIRMVNGSKWENPQRYNPYRQQKALPRMSAREMGSLLKDEA
jgi:hypothetical protein